MDNDDMFNYLRSRRDEALGSFWRKWATAAAMGAMACWSSPVFAQAPFEGFIPGDLVVSRSVYTGTASTVTVGQPLPPNCPSTAACGTTVATNNGTYPNVFLNAQADGSFGVTSPIFLDQITTDGIVINTLPVPTSIVVTSFSSKSELALNLTPAGDALTFMGYVAPVNAL